MPSRECIEGLIDSIKERMAGATDAAKDAATSEAQAIADYIDTATANHPNRGGPEPFGVRGQDPDFVADLARKIKNGMDYRNKLNQRTVLESAKKAIQLRGRAADLTLELNPKLRDELEGLNDAMARGEAIDEARMTEIKQELQASMPEAIEAIMVGSKKQGANVRKSVDASSQGYEAMLTGPLVAEVRKAGVLKQVARGEMDLDIAKELWENRPGGKPGITGNKTAKFVADIIRKQQDLAVNLKNRMGAWINKLPGYIVRHNHDIWKLKGVTPDKWIEDTIDRVDWYTTAPQAIGNRTEQVAILKTVYSELLNGAHLMNSSNSFEGVLEGVSSGLAEKLSRHRGIFFKSAEDWFEYNKLYGGDDKLFGAVVRNLKKSADNIALMESFGPDPRTVLDQSFKYLDTIAKDNPKLQKTWTGHRREVLGNLFNQLDGTASIPIDGVIASAGRGIRALNNLSSIGSASLSALSDVPLLAIERATMEDSMITGLFKGYGDALTNLFRGLGKDETRELADLIGVGLEGMMSGVLERFSPNDYAHGMWAKAQNILFKYQGLNLWTDVHKTGVGLMMTRELAMRAEKGWDAIGKNLQDTLKSYGIDGAKWDLIRNNTLVEVDGRKYVSPAKVKEIKGLTSAERQDLEVGLRSYLMDRTTFAVPSPRARERAITNLGTKPGTTTGEAVRFIMQFKSFPFTIGRIASSAGRRYASAGAGSFVMFAAHMAIATTLFGYMSMGLKDFVKGRKPRTPDTDDNGFNMMNFKLLSASVIQGGGLGIYGDLMYALETRYGTGLIPTMAGPTAGFVEDVWKMSADTIKLPFNDKEFSKYLATQFNRTKYHFPFQNFLPTRMATDYLFYKAIDKWVEPGHRDRTRRKLETEYHQDTFF